MEDGAPELTLMLDDWVTLGATEAVLETGLTEAADVGTELAGAELDTALT